MPGKKSKTPGGVTIPGTLRRSPAKAQRTYAKAKANAERQYGADERAGRTAIAAVKHGFKKVGDHWEPRAHNGSSRDGSANSGSRRSSSSRSDGDLSGHSKDELYARAKSLQIPHRSQMNKRQLAAAIARRQ